MRNLKKILIGLTSAILILSNPILAKADDDMPKVTIIIHHIDRDTGSKLLPDVVLKNPELIKTDSNGSVIYFYDYEFPKVSGYTAIPAMSSGVDLFVQPWASGTNEHTVKYFKSASVTPPTPPPVNPPTPQDPPTPKPANPPTTTAGNNSGSESNTNHQPDKPADTQTQTKNEDPASVNGIVSNTDNEQPKESKEVKTETSPADTKQKKAKSVVVVSVASLIIVLVVVSVTVLIKIKRKKK